MQLRFYEWRFMLGQILFFLHMFLRSFCFRIIDLKVLFIIWDWKKEVWWIEVMIYDYCFCDIFWVRESPIVVNTSLRESVGSSEVLTLSTTFMLWFEDLGVRFRMSKYVSSIFFFQKFKFYNYGRKLNNKHKWHKNIHPNKQKSKNVMLNLIL